MMELPSWIVAAGAFFTLISLIAAGISFARIVAVKASVEALKLTLETVTLGNDELRRLNDDLRRELVESKTAHAHLEGQMAVLTSQLGAQIATAVIAAIGTTLSIGRPHDARTRSTDTPTRAKRT